MNEPKYTVFGAKLTPIEFQELYMKLHSAWNEAPYCTPLENELESLLADMDAATGWAS